MTAAESAPPRNTSRDAATVTFWNLASRLSGFVRVLVLAGALGATRLGDTFQASNQVSNVLFEFLAAGTLSAVLVPGLVARLTSDDPAAARELAGAVLGRVLCVLLPVAVVGIVFARPLLRVVFAGNDTPSFDAQVRLGSFLLFFVLPQLLLYAWGAVVTAMLHASGRFAAAAFAPVANNIVVSAALGIFWWRGATGLELETVDKWLLGGGALLGVVAMTLVPALAARSAGLSVRPSLRSAGSLPAAEIGWATLVLLPPQLYLFGGLLVAGRVDGGVVACQVGFTLFLLPHALLGHPLATVLYPRIAADVARGDVAGATERASLGFTHLLQLTAGGAALLAALAPWIARTLAFGALDDGVGPHLVAAALAGYAIGLPAYSWTLFATRVAYARGDVRLPGLAAIAGGVAGAVVLVSVGGSDRTTLAFIGAGHSLLAVVTSGLIVVALVRRRHAAINLSGLAWASGSALAAFAVARGVANVLDGTSRIGAVGTGAAAGFAGVAVYAAGLYLSGVRDLPGREITA